MSNLREPDIIFKWTNCCRLCLSQESTIDLFSEASISQHFPSKIRTCLNFLIYSGDPMPRKICASCCIKLENWFQFRKECIQTEKDLKRRLEPYKRIAFVKEYFDKYMKYEKSSQDGSISFDSMSDYDENEEDNFKGEDDEDGRDEGEMEICCDSLQKEDDNSWLSDNDRPMLLPEHNSSQNKQNFEGNACKVNNNQNLKDAPSSVDVIGKEKETINETGKSTNNLEKVNLKHKGQNKDKYINEHSKKIYSTKDVKFSAGKAASGNLEKPHNSLCHNKVGSVKQKAAINNLKRENSVDQQNVQSVQETSVKTCPECGVDFPSEEHLALHNCSVIESGAESDDNDNFINPLSFVDTSLSEPAKDRTEGDCNVSSVTSEFVYKEGADDDEDSVKEEISVTPWKCLVCSEYFKSMLDLKQHYSSSDGNCCETDVTLECEVCKSKFPTKNEFVEHQLVHMEMEVDLINSDLSKCTGCDRQFESEAQLSQHMCNEAEGKADLADSDTRGEYFCSKCEQTFHNKELFEKHELIHNQQDLFNSIVTPQFTTFEGIEEMEEYNEDNEDFEEDKKPQNVVRCFRCGRIFNSPEELEQHEFLKHKNPTPYFCRKCDLRFSARSQLLMHVRSHMRKSTPADPSDAGGSASDNTCAICNAKFFLQSDLQSHLKMHKYSPTEESLPPPPPPPSQKTWQSSDSYGDNKIDLFARFKCSVCSKIFVHSGSIIRHGKNLHKGQTVYPLRLKRPIFLMKRARSLSLPTEKNLKNPQTSKAPNSNNAVTVSLTANSQQHQQQQEENLESEINQECKWDQDVESMKSDPNLEFGTEKCPFCEKVFKPTYLPRHIKRNHRGEVLDPQMLGKDIPDDSLVCRYCLKSCSNPHNRRVHESIHYPVKMQCTQCKICGQKFFNRSSYEVHILGCKSVRCVKCNKIFFRYLSLKNHSCIVTIPTESKA